MSEAAGSPRPRDHEPPRKHFLEMDGLRGVAAAAVALFHLQPYFGGAAFFGHGYLAVDFFYMLSGFVLTHAYGRRLQDRRGIKPFVVDRVIRLYPMLVVGAALGLAAALVHPTRSLASSIATAVVNGLGLPALWSSLPFWINEPTWSLFFEIGVNLLFALTAAFASSRREVIAVAVFGTAMLALDVHYGLLGFGWSRHTLGAGVVRVCASFAVGMLLYRLHVGGVLADGPRRWWVAPILLLSLALVPTFAWWSVVYDPAIVFGLFPVLILASAGSAVIIPRLAVLSGALSYPFYIVHLPIIALLRAGVGPDRAEQQRWIVAILIATTVIAWTILRFYDEPVRRALTRRFRPVAPRPRTP